MRLKRFLQSFVLLAVLTVSFLAVTNAQAISDWLILQRYEPTAEVAALAEKASLSGTGKRYFYVSRPEILDRDQFNQLCTSNEATIVLGCYTGQGRIYLFNVTDERLAGIKEVTAAHEMLHAAYDRLSGGQQQRVNHLIEAQLKNVSDQRVLELIDQYRQSDPNALLNEAHAIIGTELENLLPELEDYYNRYFTNRSAVVALAKRYAGVFLELESRSKQMEVDINNLKARIHELEDQLTGLKEQLDTERAQLDSLLENNQVDAYNSRVAPYNNLVNRYNAVLADYSAKIEQHNRLVEEYNRIALQHQDLIQSIDSRHQPVSR